MENCNEVVIEGRILDPIGDRSSAAPNFNGEDVWGALRAEHPELAGYQAAHLWGPGFGDEAAAGIMLAPAEFNLEWQNAGIESRIREWHKIATERGGQLEVRAAARSHDRSIGGGALLANVEYTVSVRTPDGVLHEMGRVGLTADPPPSPRVTAY